MRKKFVLFLVLLYGISFSGFTQNQELGSDTLSIEPVEENELGNDTIPVSDINAENQEVDGAEAQPEIETDPEPKVEIRFPDHPDWNVVEEGQTLAFRVFAYGNSENYFFDLVEGKNTGMNLDSTGYFSWTPDFDFVDRLEETRNVQAIFEISDGQDINERRPVEFTVRHVNRPPEVAELKNFYVKYGQVNTYQIDLQAVIDPDYDPVIFKPVIYQMPEGATLSEKGEFSWKPSLSQFNRLKQDPINMSFIVEDQPYKAQVRGNFNVLATQLDLPPEITMVPKEGKLTTDENETININFFLSDGNGDADIASFELIADDARVTEEFLRKNSATQWEFVWTPGYDFVKLPGDSITVDLRFYVVDKTLKRAEKLITITVKDTENQIKKDQLLYNQYRAALVRVWDMLEQLKLKEKDYTKMLKRARRGKKSRAIVDASLGAVTGLSPVVLDERPDTQKLVSGVGGTTVMTMGTLEATDMIGKSPSDVLENLNRVIEKKNELQLNGDVFARRYSLISARRDKDFSKDTEKLLSLLLIKNVASLELTAGWENPTKVNDKILMNTFDDYVPEDF